jgi:hypothetical protein
MENNEKDVEYIKKMKELDIPAEYSIKKEYIDMLYDIFINGHKVSKDEKQEEKKKMILSILNKILKISGKEKIKKLTDFELDRDDIIKEECREYFESKLDSIFEVFDKHTHKFYMRKQTQNFILTFLKTAIKELGHELKSNKSDNKIGY